MAEHDKQRSDGGPRERPAATAGGGPSAPPAQEPEAVAEEVLDAEPVDAEQAIDEPPAAGPAAAASEPEPEPGQLVESDIDALIARAKERDEYLELARRTHADFENYRKRMNKEQSAAERRGIARLAKELLPAVDSLSRALEAAASAGDGDASLTDGVRLVHSELTAALARVGIEPFSPKGEQFDPNEHEAMAQHQVDGVEAGTVIEVYQQGYRIDGTVLRPARVVVAG